MSEIQENNMQETLNGTQNQNNDTQVANEEAPVQTEAPQNNQDIGDQEQSTFEAAEPPAQEEGPNPADIADPAVTISSEDLVGSDPKVTMNPEDLSGPDADQEPDFDEDVSDFWDAPGNPENSSDSLPGDEIDWSPSELEAMDKPGFVAHEDENAPDIFDEDYDWDKSLSHWDVPPNQYSWDSDRDMEPSFPLGSEEPSTPLKTESEESHNHSEQEAGLGEEDGDVAPGGYDGSGIAGGLDLDQDGMPENTGINPHVQPDFPGNDPAGQAEPPDSEATAPLSPEAVSMPTDKIVDPSPNDQAGEWISGFNGDFWLDASGRMWDSPEQAASASPEEVEARPPTASATPDETYTYDEGAYEDAEDAFEDLQDALQDGDEEDLAEALEELQGYLGSFDKGATEDENLDLTGADPEEVKDATGGDPVGGNAEENPKDLGEGVMEDDGEGGTNPADVDYREVLDDLDSGNLDDVREFLENLAGGNDKEEEAQDTHDDAGNNPDMSGEDYTYDEDAYEDAEDAMKDLQDALKHGDEEDRAEALQKLQGYLGGFDKGAEEKTQDGTETQDDQIPSDSANDSDGDPEEVPNTVDKEPVDAPDASGAAVSGPAVGAAGAAVDEAKGLDQDGTETQDNQILSGSDYYDGAFGTMGDTDGDGVLNWEDSDWDTFDRDGDGKEDYLVLDADDDGIVDVKEDADGDGIVDVQDVDADNDGTDDWLVSDFDGDGIEYGKEDDDSDGIENAKDDSDGDGMLDWKDSDSDGNGIDDWVEIFSDPYEFDCFPGEDSYDYNAW